MGVVAFMPLKRNSRRVPGKNFRPLRGNPLCRWMVETMLYLRSTGAIDRAFLFATDADLHREYAPELDFLKIESAEQSSANEKVKEFASKVEADFYVELFATSPFLSDASIVKCIETAKETKRPAATMHVMQSYLWGTDGEPNYIPSKTPASDALPFTCIETTGCYAMPKDYAGIGVRAASLVPVPWPEWIDIDTEEDWQQAEAAVEWLCKRRSS